MPNGKVKLSNVVDALDAIAAWTQAVRQELQDYLTQGGSDIDLATDVQDVGTRSNKKVEEVRALSARVGKAC